MQNQQFSMHLTHKKWSMMQENQYTRWSADYFIYSIIIYSELMMKSKNIVSFATRLENCSDWPNVNRLSSQVPNEMNMPTSFQQSLENPEPKTFSSAHKSQTVKNWKISADTEIRRSRRRNQTIPKCNFKNWVVKIVFFSILCVIWTLNIMRKKIP